MSPDAPVFEVRCGSATHIGRRVENEDAYLAEGPVYAVADGMGGHERGAMAAWTAIEALRGLGGDPLPSPRSVHAALVGAAEAVRAAAGTEGAAPGSTLAGVATVDHDGVPCWLVFNIGDSRVYRVAADRMEQISVDHSRVQQMVDAGTLTSGEARAHRDVNVITRALGAGMRSLPDPDQWLLTAAAGERILICSDGLTHEVDDDVIAATLTTTTDPHVAAHRLVECAVEAGGRDNVTAVVVDALAVRGAVGADLDDLDDVTDADGPAFDTEGPGIELAAATQVDGDSRG